MAKRGKNYRASVEKFDRSQLHEVKEAMKLVTETSKAKFDETIDLVWTEDMLTSRLEVLWYCLMEQVRA